MPGLAARHTRAAPAPAANGSRVFGQLLWAVGLGILAGLFFGEAIGPVRFVGDAFIKLLQVTVLPYLLGSILSGLGRRSRSDAGRLAVRGGLVLAAFWAVALLVVAASSFAYPRRPSADWFFSPDAAAASRIDWLSLYIPSNLFSSLANNVLPAVVLFGLLTGSALSAMEGPQKATLLAAIDGFNEAMSRVARLLVRVTPIGIFAIAATTAGVMRPEQLARLQLWFVVYAGIACITSFWLLPGLVAMLTPIPYRSFVGCFRNALLTAFAAGDLFIVLPLITEQARELLKAHDISSDEADATVGVVIPLLFNFPHTGKILSLAFVPFAAWFSGGSLSLAQWGTLFSAGLMALFGSLSGAIPFVLDLLRLPADLFGLFSMSSALNGRFGSLVAAVHTAALAIVIAVALTRGLRLHLRRLLWFGAASAVIVALFVGGTRAFFSFVLPAPAAGSAALEGFKMRPPFTPTVLKGAAQAPAVRPAAGRRLEEITSRGVLRVGYLPDSVPYAFFSAAGDLIGYDIEMANVLARDLNVSLEFVEITREHAAAALDSGACDMIMCGFVISATRAREIQLSRAYEQERLGFLVPDYARSRYASLEAIQNEHLRIGVPAIDDIAPLIRQQLSGATFIRFRSIDAVVDAISKTIDAAVLPIDRAFYFSRINPELSAVLPIETTSSVMLGYGLPTGELGLRNVVDAWIEVKRGQGEFASAHAYWIRGEGLRPRQPRWSIARNLLGWQR